MWVGMWLLSAPFYISSFLNYGKEAKGNVVGGKKNKTLKEPNLPARCPRRPAVATHPLPIRMGLGDWEKSVQGHVGS